jgi:predicted Zn-dependent peptidase
MTEEAFGDLTDAGVDTFIPAEVQQTAPRSLLLQRPTNEAHLCLSMPGVPYTDDRRYAQEMIDAVLSSGMSSRLFQEIRERLGLAYEVYSYFREYADVGQGVLYAGIDPQRLDFTVRALLDELAKLRDQPVPEDELERTKELRKGRILMGLEDSRALAGWIGGQELIFNEILTPEEVMERIDRVTSADMQTLAQELFRVERLNLAVIGPLDDAERLQSLLSL